MDFIFIFCDCISISNKGDEEVLEIYKKYPEGNCYKNRDPHKTGSAPGNIEICPLGGKTVIVNMFTKFYPNKVEFLNDNKKKRRIWLESCLQKFLDQFNTFAPALQKKEIIFHFPLSILEDKDKEAILDKIMIFNKNFILKFKNCTPNLLYYNNEPIIENIENEGDDDYIEEDENETKNEEKEEKEEGIPWNQIVIIS